MTKTKFGHLPYVVILLLRWAAGKQKKNAFCSFYDLGEQTDHDMDCCFC